jgi:UDP-N-acetylmuramoylalanine--D-glutamate ligase
MESLAKQKVLVLGLGVTGHSAANFCALRGADVIAADERPEQEIQGLDNLAPQVERVLGQPFPDPADFDLVVPSPGIAPERYRDRARCVWGDIELAYRSLHIPIIAVTGTNGKSTTVRLLEVMLRASGARARAAGNVGTPALDLVGQPLDFAILEISSFQLETIETFRPEVAVVLNVTPDHLDRHGSLDAYAAAKARILANQQATNTAVLNMDDARVAAFANETKARVVPVRCAGPAPGGAWLDAGSAVVTEASGETVRIPLDGMRLRGAHNLENAVFAFAIANAAGADPRRAAAALATFAGLPHRGEVVAVVSGVSYVDDSKATNPGAAAAAIESIDGTVVWIAGGRGKGLDFGALAKTAKARVRAALLIGEAAEKLAAELDRTIDVQHCASIEAAVDAAAKIANPGDVVLLAPACASQDQFRDYRERGERFRKAVEGLQSEGERG